MREPRIEIAFEISFVKFYLNHIRLTTEIAQVTKKFEGDHTNTSLGTTPIQCIYISITYLR